MARNAVTDSTSSLLSSCSGSGMTEVVHDMLFRSLGGTPYLSHSCEMIGFKREHLMQTVHTAVQAERACCSHEFGELSRGMALCVVHNQLCSGAATGRGSDRDEQRVTTMANDIEARKELHDEGRGH